MRDLIESLEHGDLKRLIHNELHIDEFKSKMGDDDQVVVVSFKVAGKEPSNDIVSFVEKGYDWVIDADVSSGEMYDGDYIVFVELPRDEQVSNRIMEMMEDLMNLTEQDIEEWRVRYYRSNEEHPLELDKLKNIIPDSSEKYHQIYGKKSLDKLKTAAGVRVDTKAPKNDLTDSIRIAAGIL